MAAGIVQGVTGFGSGIVQMMTFPMFWSLPVAAAMATCIAIPLNINMVLTYLREIRWKKVILPIIPYMVICSAAISYSRLVNQAVMKKVFGGFLIILAVYYLFFNRSDKKTPLNLPKTIIYIIISALSDAFFGIGGPLMVLYFLNKSETTREYYGNISAFFLINSIYNSIYRILCGIITLDLLPFLGAGLVIILIGVTIAHKLVSRMNDALLKKVPYLMIGLTGILNLFA